MLSVHLRTQVMREWMANSGRRLKSSKGVHIIEPLIHIAETCVHGGVHLTETGTHGGIHLVEPRTHIAEAGVHIAEAGIHRDIHFVKPLVKITDSVVHIADSIVHIAESFALNGYHVIKNGRDPTVKLTMSGIAGLSWWPIPLNKISPIVRCFCGDVKR